MALRTKYGRQLANAQRLIKRKGVLVTWLKAYNTNISDDTSPEFPRQDTPTKYPVWMAFYPADRQELATVIAEKLTGSFSNQTFAVMAGGLRFTPAEGDEVVFPDGKVVHCKSLNITQPDLVPIIYEVSFE